MVNERLKKLAVNISAELLEHLNQMDDITLQKTVRFYEEKDGFIDGGIGQVLRLYQTARTIGRVANRPER